MAWGVRSYMAVNLSWGFLNFFLKILLSYMLNMHQETNHIQMHTFCLAYQAAVHQQSWENQPQKKTVLFTNIFV